METQNAEFEGPRLTGDECLRVQERHHRSNFAANEPSSQILWKLCEVKALGIWLEPCGFFKYLSLLISLSLECLNCGPPNRFLHLLPVCLVGRLGSPTLNHRLVEVVYCLGHFAAGSDGSVHSHPIRKDPYWIANSCGLGERNERLKNSVETARLR